MRLMEHFGISGLTDTLKRIISNAVNIILWNIVIEPYTEAFHK